MNGQSSMWETFADFADLLPLAALSDRIISRKLPDIKQYLNVDEKFGSDVRWRLTEPLAKALRQGDDILILSHRLGTVLAYDVLWKFSYYGEWQDIRNKKVSMLVTLGSPLGDESVKCWHLSKVSHFC